MAVSSDLKLHVYNRALFHLGSRQLASLTEAREPRRVLDALWGSGDRAVKLALERAEWNFALRAVVMDHDAGIDPVFGFSKAFAKPNDFRRLAALSHEPDFVRPLTTQDYQDEGGYWFANVETLYARYVSDDDGYGMNGAGWSESFTEYLSAWLAAQACERITNSTTKRGDLYALAEETLRQARGHDAMQEGVKFPPAGSWVRARTTRRRDGGPRDSLT